MRPFVYLNLTRLQVSRLSLQSYFYRSPKGEEIKPESKHANNTPISRSNIPKVIPWGYHILMTQIPPHLISQTEPFVST